MNIKKIFVTCPHCSEHIEIEKINCAIFRHGVTKKDFKQISPHESKINCDKLFIEQKIYGCGKPFKIIKEDDKYIAIECDYI